MNMVICDDDLQQGDILRGLLLSLVPDGSIEFFSTGIGLLQHLFENTRVPPNIIFLDIDMPEINGIETARKIRERLDSVYIVFITGYVGFALSAFDVYAFDYIIKPINKERLANTIGRILSRQSGGERHILVKSRGMSFKVRQEEIYFVEKVYNRCILYTKDFTYHSVSTLKTVYDELDSDMFIQTHKAYIVNKNKIKGFSAFGNQAYEIFFSDFPRTARLSRGMNKQLRLI